MVENIFDTPSVSQSPPKPAISSIIIRSADPDSVLAQLPLDLRQRAKVYKASNEAAKQKYAEDKTYRDTVNKASLKRSNARYAADPDYRARRSQLNREYYARRKAREREVDSATSPERI